MPLVLDEPIRCSNPECKVAENGRCIEGIEDLDSCTHYGKDLLIVERPTSISTSQSVQGVQLPSAAAIQRAGAQLMLRDRPCHLASIVGPVGSGKTSLITGIFDLFQQGPVDGFSFAGSSTLHSFEQACHDTRRASQQKSPMMERTPTGDATFFHLDLVLDGCTSKRSAMLANRSGEDYMEAQTNPSLTEQFFELHRADTITMLADGVRLLDSGLRHQIREDILQTLRAFVESGAIRPWQNLAVVLTKLDAIHESTGKSERVLQYFENILVDVRDKYKNYFVEIQSFHVAASPQSSRVIRGEGMAKLLHFWMSEPARLRPAAVSKVRPEADRSFGKLTLLARHGHE